MSTRGLFIALAVSCIAVPTPASSARGDDVLVATASNFAAVVERLEADFESSTGHDLRVVSGSTGKLYAQILRGAPFEILLAADQQRPARLVAEGLAEAKSRRTYARGRLVLWSSDPERIGRDGKATLREADFRRLALANPDLAPYGVAAREVLGALQLDRLLADRLVMGENIGQAFALVATGNAELGFVAASQIDGSDALMSGSRWVVPSDLHGPIRQDAVLLGPGTESVGARAFLAYLASPEVKDLIRSFGYDVD
jgi:molybdate transport system substrate-binding protein